MTTTTDTPGASPAAAAVAALGVAFEAAMTAVRGEQWRSSDGEVKGQVVDTHQFLAFALSLHLSTVAEMNERGIAEVDGAISTRAWLRHRLNETPAAASLTAKLATACSTKGPHARVGDALAAGEVNPDQFRVIVKALNKLPAKAAVEHREFSANLLLEKAAELNADDLRKIGKGLREAADPDGTLDDDEEIDRVRGVHYRDHHDGTHSVTWRDRVENIALLKAAVGALDAPKPQENGAADSRSPQQRRADGMVHIFGTVLSHGDLPHSRGVAPHLHVTAALDTLKGANGAAKAALATGGALTLEALRLLACDSAITPIALDAKGKPLSVGRTTRIWTPAIWAALVARDTGCAFPACDIPSWVCKGHHMKHWVADHGPTELDNGVLLCDPHHVQVHHRGWTVRLDEHGIPEFVPPPWIDSLQRPRRNHHYLLQKGLLVPPTLPDIEYWE